MNRAQNNIGHPSDIQIPYVLQCMRDWEMEELILEARREEEERKELLQTAFSLAPIIKLEHLERNWWIAYIDEPLERLLEYSFPEKELEGAIELHRPSPQTLVIRTELPAPTLLENIEMLYLPF